MLACGHDTGGKDSVTGAPVTVAVTALGLPAPGLQVYFQDADSTLVANVQTGSDGTARAATPAGGFVTVVQPGSSATLYTYAGVEPDDVLLLDTAFPPAPGSGFSFDVIMPTDTTTGVTAYHLYTSCSAAGPVVTASGSAQILLTNCADGLADMLVVTTDGSNQPIDSLYEAGVAVGSGASVTLTGSYVPLPVLTDVIDDFTWPPTNIDVGLTLMSPHGSVFFGALYGVGPMFLPTPIGSAASLTFAWPTIPDGQVVSRFGLSPGSDVLSEAAIEQWGPSSQPVTLDFAATHLRDFTTAPAFDPPTHTVSWTVGATGNAPEVELAFIDVQRGSGSAAPQWGWEILGPGGSDGHLVLPVLPDEPFDFNIQTGDVMSIAFAEDASATSGAAALRNALFDYPYNAYFEQPGTLVTSLWLPP